MYPSVWSNMNRGEQCTRDDSRKGWEEASNIYVLEITGSYFGYHGQKGNLFLVAVFGKDCNAYETSMRTENILPDSTI